MLYLGLIIILTMKRWKVVIIYLGNTLEVIIEAKSYSEAHISAERIYFGGIVKNISEINS